MASIRRRRFMGGSFTSPIENHDELGSTEEMKLLPGEQPARMTDAVPKEWVGEGGRCSRCCKYFKDKEDRDTNPCTYHPGKFFRDGQFQLNAWTCCKEVEEHCKGCFVGSRHVQCLVTLDAMQRMEISQRVAAPSEPSEDDIVSARVEHARAAGWTQDESPIVVALDEVDAKRSAAASEEYWEHEYKAGETLMGIALAYDVSVADVKRANKIFSDYLDPGRKYLLVPKKGGVRPGIAPVPPRKPTKTQLASQLVELARREGLEVRREEAAFYVDDADDDVQLAMTALRRDLEWEQSQTGAKDSVLGEPASPANPLKQVFSMFREVFV